MRQTEAKQSVPQAKNKAENFDWDRVFSTWKPLTELPQELIASEAEQERVLSVYNRALEKAAGGNADIAKIALDKLTTQWPQFAEAASLYGVILARERQFREAEEQFEKVLLASPDAALAKAVDRCRIAAREERIRAQARDSRRKKSEELLMPVRAHMAKSGILQRAIGEEGTGRIQMASKREQEEVYRLEQGDMADSARRHSTLVRLIQGLTVAIIVASLLFLLFFFVLRPVILRNEARLERLNWLERVLEEQRDDPSISDILDIYRDTFPPEQNK